MRKYWFISLMLALLFGCNDGDIITVELEFDQELQICNNNTQSLLLYDIKTEDPFESLTLLLPRNSTVESIFVTPTESLTFLENLSTTGYQFNYRVYNALPTFCQLVEDPDLRILENYESDSGEIFYHTTISNDDFDGDGIPNLDEGSDPNGDGDTSDAIDTDGDGLPDFLDEDDDNDNVFTKDEDDNDDEDDNPFTNPKNSDGDELPNYLDPDDDGDTVLTILEDENGNQNPEDDFPNGDVTLDPLYLNAEFNTPFELQANKITDYTIEFRTIFELRNISLDIIDTTVLDFGSIASSITVEVDQEEED